MESFLIRYRNLLVLLAILVAKSVGLAVQAAASDTRAQRSRPARRARCTR